MKKKSSSKPNIRPLGDRVLVEPLSEEEKNGTTGSGIIIPETVGKERSEQGRVLAVGPGKKNESGEISPVEVEVGQRIIFSKFGPDEVKINDEDYMIISESNILAVIEE